jgi:uncharacterized protein YecE (DUF72 family)
LPDYLVGTGGWSYFNVLSKSSLGAYSEVFNFVEVNQTFYEYLDDRRLEAWRRTVPKNFVFSVRCHQDLTHRIGLKPVDDAYGVIDRMITCCGLLKAPFLVLETPASYKLSSDALLNARDFLSSLNLTGVRLVWEIRAPLTDDVVSLMQDLHVVHCIDLSRVKPSFSSDVAYSRLFGKGKHNIYQFTDDELVDIDRKARGTEANVVALSYHGVRMYSDAARFLKYKRTGNFMPVTPFVGVGSVKAVLSEDSKFPLSKSELIEDQGWKVVDISVEKRVHLSDLLASIPSRTYNSVDEVVSVLEVAL